MHLVFVYGTLKPGGHYWPEFCEGKVAAPRPAKVRGTLYDLHLGYPGLRLSGTDWVHGYLLTFWKDADFLRLDELEGYNPSRPDSENEYTRLRVACFSPDGEPIGEAWTYEINLHLLKECEGTHLPDGYWPI